MGAAAPREVDISVSRQRGAGAAAESIAAATSTTRQAENNPRGVRCLAEKDANAREDQAHLGRDL